MLLGSGWRSADHQVTGDTSSSFPIYGRADAVATARRAIDSFADVLEEALALPVDPAATPSE